MGWIIDLLKDVPLSAVMKERFIDAEKKVSVLEQQNKYLQTSLDQATKEIERLNEIINVFQKNQTIKKYDEITKKILKLFFDTSQELSVNQVAANFSINISTAQYHFDLLSEAKLIIQTTIGDKSSWTGETTPDLFKLTPLGRKYVIGNILP